MEHVKLTTPFIKEISKMDGTKAADTLERNLQIWIGKASATFYCVFKHEGRQRFIKLGRWPKMQADEARELTKKRIAEVLNHTFPTSEGAMITVGLAIDEYIAHLKNKHTKDTVVCMLRRFFRHRNTRLSMMTTEDIVKVHNENKDKPVTANRTVKYLRAAINLAIENHHLNIVNPAKNIRMYDETPRDRYLEKSEGARFLEAAKQLSQRKQTFVQANAILMMLYTGARKMNVLKMRFDEIDGNGKWTIPKYKFKGGRKEHEIELGKREMEIVELMRPLSKHGNVFEYHGRALSSVRRTINEILKIAGIENLHLHDLRRTLGTWMLSTGAPIEVVSKKLGHSSIRVTEQVYAHMLPSVSRDATEHALDEMLGDNGKQ